MRKPSRSEARNTDAYAAPVVGPRPSDPDQPVLNENVGKAGPHWIVVEAAGPTDHFAAAALRRGAVFASSPSFRPEVLKAAEESGRPLEDVVRMPLPGLAPPARVTRQVSLPDFEVDVSSLAVPPLGARAEAAPIFSDVAGSTGDIPSGLVRPSEPPPSEPRSKRPSRSHFAAAFGIVAMSAALTFAWSAYEHAGAASAAVPALAPPATPAVAPPAETSLAPVTTATETPQAAPAGPKRLGTVHISSSVRHKSVWLDGKLIAGSGRRSFLVPSGKHVVAVGDGPSREIDVPFGGEYRVTP